MADLTGLLSAIGVMVGDERGSRFASSTVTALVNDAIRELAMITRNYNIVDTLAVTAPGPTNLPQGFISMNRIELDTNPLWRLDYRQVKQYKNSTASLPTFYVIRGNQLHLYPVPTDNLTLDIDYIGTPPDLEIGSEFPDDSLGMHKDAYIKAYVARELSVIGQDFEAAQHWTGQLGLLEMRTREYINSPESYENQQVYSDGPMAYDSRGTAWDG